MTKYTNKQLKEMQQVWKDEIAMRGPKKIRKNTYDYRRRI